MRKKVARFLLLERALTTLNIEQVNEAELEYSEIKYGCVHDGLKLKSRRNKSQIICKCDCTTFHITSG